MKKKKPVVWIVGAVVAVGIIGGAAGNGSENPSDNERNPNPSFSPIASVESSPVPSDDFSVDVSSEPEVTPPAETTPPEAPVTSEAPDPGPSVEPSAAQSEEPSVEPTGEPIPSVDPEQAFRDSLMQYNYVGSSESDKYHKPTCRWTSEINDTNLIHFDTIEEAKAAGYEACGTCKPR